MAQFFFKRDGSDAIRAILGISMVQMLILFILSFITVHFTLSAQYLHLHSKQSGEIGVFITLLLIFYNYKKYKGRYSYYREYWQDEVRSQRLLKGYLVLISLILPWIAVFLIATYLKW
ncbi:hypothetical protein [Mucilaginibacter sp.]